MKVTKVFSNEVKERHFKEFLLALEETEIKPSFTDVAKISGLAVTTIWDRWKIMEDKYDIKCTITVRKKH